jgi:hypothetical protein
MSTKIRFNLILAVLVFGLGPEFALAKVAKTVKQKTVQNGAQNRRPAAAKQVPPAANRKRQVSSANVAPPMTARTIAGVGGEKALEVRGQSRTLSMMEFAIRSAIKSSKQSSEFS